MPDRDPRDAPPHRRRHGRRLDAAQQAELERYVAEFAADWDAREERLRSTFELMVREGVMSSEERDERLAEIHESRLEHERDHREGMIDALLTTDEEWEAIVNDPEFQEQMAQLQAMAEGMAEAFGKLEFHAEPDDPVARTLLENLQGSAQRLANGVDGAADAARPFDDDAPLDV